MRWNLFHAYANVSYVNVYEFGLSFSPLCDAQNSMGYVQNNTNTFQSMNRNFLKLILNSAIYLYAELIF